MKSTMSFASTMPYPPSPPPPELHLIPEQKHQHDVDPSNQPNDQCLGLDLKPPRRKRIYNRKQNRGGQPPRNQHSQPAQNQHTQPNRNQNQYPPRNRHREPLQNPNQHQQPPRNQHQQPHQNQLAQPTRNQQWEPLQNPNQHHGALQNPNQHQQPPGNQHQSLCPNQHPQPYNQNPLPEASESEPQSRAEKLAILDYQRQMDAAIRVHKLQMQELRDKVDNLVSASIPDNARVEDPAKLETAIKTRQAYEFKLTELGLQLEVYKRLKGRTIIHYKSKSKNKELLAHLHRELYRFKNKLPIFSKRLEIEDYVENFNENSRFLIIQGETGSGKSTQLPQYFADHPRFEGKKILCIQPRKIAAISLASRVTFEYYCGDTEAVPGYLIGYRVAGDNNICHNTRIEFVTEGRMLENIISGDPQIFKNVGAIILDEAHERSINCDLLLGCFKYEDQRWKNIMIVVTSATIDLDLFSDFFNKAPSIVVPGRTFPVAINYRPCPGFGFFENTQAIIKACIQCVLHIHLSSKITPGDILCFLPGQADVLSAVDMFDITYKAALSKIDTVAIGTKFLEPLVLPLYGRLEPEMQAKVFEQFDGEKFRKIIFATDIAETSVTIEGVVHVVDSGVKKGIVYDPKRKISSLRIQQISKSSAIQRMGRAGRTKPGKCYRLYSQEDFESMEFGRNPEVLARPLSLAILSLRKMKMEPLLFPWISKPPMDSLRSAEEELLYLGALVSVPVSPDEEAVEQLELTELGHLISTVQQEPTLVKMIQFGCQKGFGEAAITLASIFSASSIFYYFGSDPETKSKSLEKKKGFSHADGDVVSLFRAYEEWQRVSKNGNSGKGGGIWCRDNFVNGKAMKIIMATAKELRMYFCKTKPWKATDQNKKPENEDLSRIAFAGLFLNTSHIMKTRQSQWRVQYYSLFKGVPGFCSRDSALLQIQNEKPPDWIIYDRILQVPVTLFLTCNKVTEEWIREENEVFYDHCLQESRRLPTAITRQLSPELVSTLVGKFYTNIRTLETELESTIESDLESGQFTLFCAKNVAEEVERKLDVKVSSILDQLGNRVIEQEYLGGCRLLIGQGFHIKEVLFSEDFVTLYLRNLPIGTTEDHIKEMVEDQDPTCTNNQIQNIQVFRGGNPVSAVITFSSKEFAQEFNERLCSYPTFLNGSKIFSNPSLSRRKGISAEITGKLKFSWATGQSQQQAKLWFKTGIDANNFIDRAHILLSGAVVQAVSSASTEKNKNKIPPTVKVHAVRGDKAANYRFDLDALQFMSDTEKSEFEYTVTVRNIGLRLDEYDIMESLRHLNLTSVRVFRNRADVLPDRDELLQPVQGLLTTHLTYLFSDEMYRRAGVSISFIRLGALREAYREIVSSAPWSQMEKPFGQTPRLEVEYYYVATILIELYVVLENEFEQIMKYGKSLGVHVQNRLPKRQIELNETKQQKSKFVFIRFQSSSEVHFPEIKRRMQKVTACEKFKSDSIALLFNSTGKDILNKFQFKRYLFTSFHSQTIWIYGEEELRKKIVGLLSEELNRLKALDFLDHQFTICKKGVKNNRDRDHVHRVCSMHARSLEYYEIRGSKITVSGSLEAVTKLKSQLEKDKLIFTHKPRKNPHLSTLDCGLCFTQPDDRKYAITTNCLNKTNCDRMFCQECIQPMFEQVPPPFPLKCPSCETLLVIGDIVKWASASSLQKIMEMAIQKYKEDNLEKILSCPKPGCEQLLATSSIKKGDWGGSFVFCDECATTYCLDCSKKMDKAVEMHEDESCEEFLSGSPNRAYIHVNHIREKILNLSCPRCETAFLDFDGCAALTCGNTACHCCFCALCLKDCGADSHPHVKLCHLNPTRDFFVNKEVLTKAHREQRITKIKEYMNSVKEEERERVRSILCKDLIALKINLSDI